MLNKKYLKGLSYFVMGFVVVWITGDPLVTLVIGICVTGVIEWILVSMNKKGSNK